MKSIILFFKKFFAWFLSLFLDRNRTKKKKKINKKVSIVKEEPKKAIANKTSHRNEDMGDMHIIDIYPYTTAKEVKSIYELLDEVKEKVILIPNLPKEDIKAIDELKEVINEELNILQTEQIKEILIDTLEDEDLEIKEEKEVQEVELNAHDRILNITKDINEIVDNKLDKHEEDLIEKAFYKYEKVNYVIATTMEIDELEEEINDLVDEVKVNNYKKSHYLTKVKEIQKKIERLEKINKNIQVQEELKKLKEDFYTKSVDKYDLLYNKEVFISLNSRCDEIIDILDEREKSAKEENKLSKEEEKALREQEKEDRKIKEEEKEQRRKARREEIAENHKNILRRYRDLKLSNAIILTNILNHSSKINKKEIVEVLRNDYEDYLNGEENTFYFDRNKKKTEVCKLYNNLLQVLSGYQNVEYQPVTHINYPYITLLEETSSIKDTVDRMTYKKTGHDMLLDEKSVAVSDKLNKEISLEKEKRKEKGLQEKVLIRKIGEQ